MKAVTLFPVEKDYNPENVLIVHSFVNETCQFAYETDKTLLIDMYWNMRRGLRGDSLPCRKETAEAFKYKTRQAITVKELSPDRRMLKLELKELRNGNRALPSSELEVRLEDNGGCRAKVMYRVNGGMIQVHKVLGQAETFGLAAVGIKSFSIQGSDSQNGKEIKVDYSTDLSVSTTPKVIEKAD